MRSARFGSWSCPRQRFLAELFLTVAIATTGACTSGGSDRAAPETPARDSTPTGRLPVIDMHLHAFAADANGPPPMALCVPVVPHMPPWDPKEPWGQVFMRTMKNPPCPDPVWSPTTDEALMNETLTAMDRRNVIGVLSGTPERVRQWRAAAPGRFIPSVDFILGRDDIPADEMRRLFRSGDFEVFGEISNQYEGIAPDDERMEPYWTLAEELDIPVAIHLGAGPPGVPYLGSGIRISQGSALLLEDVLVRHPRMRISLMHYGHQRFDDTIALLEHHPQVYVDLGGIQWWYPRPFFHTQLQTLFDAGFGKRVMFGSDQMNWPGLIEHAIAAVEDAPFLNDE
jgi:predicted TIM-barrel fold metal-dependent hydrolase